MAEHDLVPTARQDKARGCLLGAACGDELGAAFEGAPHVNEDDLDAWLAADEPVRATDDTVMMRVLAEHLVERLGERRGERGGRHGDPAGGVSYLDEDALMEAFVRVFRDEPWRGYGPGTAHLLEQVAGGQPWQEASARQFGGSGSLGNGGAMRVAPAGLLALPMNDVDDLARRSAALTHAHPLGTEGAALQARAVALAYGSDPAQPCDRDAFLDQLARYVTLDAYAERLQELRRLPADASAEDTAARTGNDITALSAVPAAVAAFVRHPDVPADAIRFAISLGGDTDTIATMAGAIAGARCGESALLAGWLQRLEDPDGLRALADRLAAVPARS